MAVFTTIILHLNLIKWTVPHLPEQTRSTSRHIFFSQPNVLHPIRQLKMFLFRRSAIPSLYPFYPPAYLTV